jgi:hypothetical protein
MVPIMFLRTRGRKRWVLYARCHDFALYSRTAAVLRQLKSAQICPAPSLGFPLSNMVSQKLFVAAGSVLTLGTSAVQGAPYDNGKAHQSALRTCAAAMNGQLPNPVPSNFHFSGNVRRYYVAAEEVEWDYAPTGWDNWLGVRVTMKPRDTFEC